MTIIINIDVMLAKRKMSVTELSNYYGESLHSEKWESKSSSFFNIRSDM
ncbi:hypothetical protein SAMN05421578_1342 [Paenibacillus macquariensis]|uniref:Uncharacterized protein n=1 Tax=Paenibacillus macquariensis TaxID=948756 RepID=A0ABY1KE25_9BACL|nr:hypothetical protein SAMN05421578_1342 [Paenibacillus macquariensis]